MGQYLMCWWRTKNIFILWVIFWLSEEHYLYPKWRTHISKYCVWEELYTSGILLWCHLHPSFFQIDHQRKSDHYVSNFKYTWFLNGHNFIHDGNNDFLGVYAYLCNRVYGSHLLITFLIKLNSYENDSSAYLGTYQPYMAT